MRGFHSELDPKHPAKATKTQSPDWLFVGDEVTSRLHRTPHVVSYMRHRLFGGEFQLGCGVGAGVFTDLRIVSNEADYCRFAQKVTG